MKWALEIDLDGWDTFAKGVAVSEAGDIETMRDLDDLRGWYMGRPKEDLIWSRGATNAIPFLVHATPHERWTGYTAGGALIAAHAVGGGAEIRDITALFPSISIGPETAPEDVRALALLEVSEAWIARMEAEGFAVYSERGSRPRLTIGSVAWHTARALAGMPNKPLSWAEFEAGHRAYYGGRTEVGRVEWPEGHRYDLRSAYPWALTQPMPIGDRIALGWASATRAYNRGVPGAYRAIVHQRSGGDLALLPHRERAREIGRGERGRILWTTGTLDDWWTLPELQAAERHGARIERIIRANVWSHEEPIFEPYIRHAYGARLRAEAAGDLAWAEAMKLAANALSGKLAQQAHADVVQILGRDDDPLIGWRWHGGRVWSQRVRRVAPSARPIVAATMTALVRVRVLDRLMRHAGRWLYCDTDSTYLEQPDESDTGNALGAWKSEGVARSWRALAPKLYRYRDADGNEEVRARGIAGATWATIDDIAAGLATSPDGRARIRAGLRVGRSDVVLGWRDVDREWAGMRRVDPRTGRTVPLHRFEDGQYALPERWD